MKNSFFKFSLIAVIGVLATLAGCQTASMLSKKVEGDWSATPIRFDKKTGVDGTFTPVFRFQRQGDTRGGDLTVSANLSVTLPVNAPIDSLGTTAVSATAAGTASVRGTWRATDDDEIELTYDMSTLVVNFDPDVQFELANIWASTDVPTERSVSTAVKNAFVKKMTEGMTSSLHNLDDIDDISIKDNLMSCKFLKEKRSLNRVFD